jgi:hypothetical protein
VRLPRDYSRCQDGSKCPFAPVCARRTTLVTDISGGFLYYTPFYLDACRNLGPSNPEFRCDHLIVDPDA